MKFYKTIIQPLIAILDPSDRRKGAWIMTLIVFNSLLDFFSIASFLPLLFFVVNAGQIPKSPPAKWAFPLAKFGSPTQVILAITVAILLFVILKNVISRWIASVKTTYAFRICNSIASRAMARYLERSYQNFSGGDFTRELNSIVNYPFAFANNMILPFTTLISEAFVSALIIIAIAAYDWKVLILILIILTPIVALYQLRKKQLKEISVTLKEKYPLLLKHALQVIEGFSEIKSSQTASFFRDRFNKISKDVSGVFAKDQLIQSGTVRLTEIIVGVLICSLVIYSVSFQQNYQQTLLLLGIYAGASFRVIPSVNRILHASQQLRMHEHLLEEFASLPHHHLLKQQIDATLTFDKKIELKEVSFSYAAGNKILNNINLVIKKGDKIAITGKSGEGKTTLLLLILRFLKTSSGEILVDNNAIDDDAMFRKLIGYVPQNPYILDGTIAENIAFGVPSNEIDRDKVKRIIQQLDLNNLVTESRDGIDSITGERGIKLSGGQRQRIAIARTLYADKDILLLDEITNQVHALMEEEILRILDRLSVEEKTIIMVTHKITKTKFFDYVYSLDEGILHEVKVQPYV